MIYANNLGFLVSDYSVDELHSFAGRLGLTRESFVDHPRHPYYSLTRYSGIRDAIIPDVVLIRDAFEKGAKVVSLRRLNLAIREWRSNHLPVGISKSLQLYRESGFLGV